MKITYNDALKDIRTSARKVGLTFKKSNTTLNGAYLWKLVNRKTGEIVLSNYRFWTAYEDHCSGYIESIKL